MKEIYNNQTYLHNHPTWHEEDAPWKAAKVFEALTKYNLKPSTVAEIGCGTGEIVRVLSEKMPEVAFSGFDISEDVFAMAKNKESAKLHFECLDLLTTEKKFDVLLVIDVFEHVENYIEFIRQCQNHAKYVLFHIPLDMSVQKLLRPQTILHNRYHTGHLHYFSKETAIATVKDTGFEIIGTDFTRWGLETKQPSLLKNVGKIPLYLLDLVSTDLAARVLGGNSLLITAKSPVDSGQ